MKKIILLATVFVAASTLCFAQNNTKYGEKAETSKESKFHGTVMSKPNKVDYGFYFGYGGDHLAWTGGLVLDINCARNNYRTRIAVEGLERWYWPAVSVHAQYLMPIAGGLYFYPSVGIRGEIHLRNAWRKSYCEKHDIVYDPDAEWGPGSWGVGADLGGGLEYQFCPYVALFAEGRYTIMYNTNFRWQANLGLTFHFGKGHRNKMN